MLSTRNCFVLVVVLGYSLIGCFCAMESPATIRATVHDMTVTGRVHDIIDYLNKVERSYGTLLIDDVVPSLLSYKGVALYNALRVQEAEEVFKLAVKHFPKDTRSWINLGELQVQTFKLGDAFNSFNAALREGDTSALPRAVRTKGWSASWEYFEALTARLEVETALCLESMSKCRIDSSGGLEYCDLDPRAHVIMNALSPNSQPAQVQIPQPSIAPLWREDEPPAAAKAKNSIFSFVVPTVSTGLPSTEVKRLKVGFMSADFGVHPVAQLVRGLFQFINASRVEVFCFSLQPKVSWWGQNISETVEHFVWLQNMNTLDAAKEIARLGVEILIDLNGHTMHSGLTIMTHQPAPLQMSYLGLPTTTAASFIDYYIADSVAVPPEQRSQYSEQLVLMSDCYIANDYAQIQGDVLKFNGPQRAPRSALNGPEGLSDATFLFGTLSNSQKMDPAIFQVWVNILRRFPGSQMGIVEHAGSSVYIPNLHRNGLSFGIEEYRFVGIKQTPWIDHLYVKTSFDLMLDTVTKNGHTTGLDSIWSGVPTLSLAGGREAPARAGESIAVSLESTLGLAYSLKEYEDMAFALAMKSKRSKKRRAQRSGVKSSVEVGVDVEVLPTGTSSSEHIRVDKSSVITPTEETSKSAEEEGCGERRLRLWRQHVGTQRSASNLFDMPRYEQQFTRLLQGTWELSHIAKMNSAFQRHAGLFTSNNAIKDSVYNLKKLFHIFATISGRYQSRDDLLGEHDAQRVATEAAVARLNNRDQQGQLRVSQTVMDDSLIKAAAEALRTGQQISGSKRSKTSAHHSSHKPQIPSIPLSKAKDGIEDRDSQRKTKKKFPEIPRFVFDGRLIMLNIGGLKPQDGWLTVNSQLMGNVAQGWEVDIVREMDNLYGFQNNSVSAIYSSHTLEHNSFGDKALENTLAEWFRVLRPGGILLISVPNLETLARMLLDESFDLQDQWLVTRMIYGAQTDAFDYHKVGFTFKLLSAFLHQAGFCKIERVSSFNLFADTSELTVKNYFISLNVAAKVCPDQSQGARFGNKGLKPDDGFNVDHQATPYDGR